MLAVAAGIGAIQQAKHQSLGPSSFVMRHALDFGTSEYTRARKLTGGFLMHFLYIKWNFVRGSFVRWCPPFLFVLYVLLYNSVVHVLRSAQHPQISCFLKFFRGIWPMPLSLLNHSALVLFAQRTRIPTSARSIGFCAIWVCISSSSSSCASDKKAGHGHKKGYAPRALHGALIHGHRKAANKGARCSAPN